LLTARPPVLAAAGGVAGGVLVLALCAATIPGAAPQRHGGVAPAPHIKAVGTSPAVGGDVSGDPGSAVNPAGSAGPSRSTVAAPTAALAPARAPAPSPAAASIATNVAPVSLLARSGIPMTALLAYQNAAARAAQLSPSCHLPWPLLAGIGRVESNHGRFAGAVLHSDGVSTPRIIGIALDGHGTALIRDTDHGALDGDTVYDRAVGPMQFIPSTWAGWGVDANRDGRKDPFNIIDEAAAAADYLCAAGSDLATAAGQVRAVLSYNHSSAYGRTVLGLEKLYAAATGVRVPILPTTPGAPAPPGGHAPPPHLPPVDPGPPRGVTPLARPAPCASPGARPATCAPSSTTPGRSSSAPSPVPSSSPPVSLSSPPVSLSSPPVSLSSTPVPVSPSSTPVSSPTVSPVPTPATSPPESPPTSSQASTQDAGTPS
jgi:membrane-bound lytic murein transglycosylase B